MKKTISIVDGNILVLDQNRFVLNTRKSHRKYQFQQSRLDDVMINDSWFSGIFCESSSESANCGGMGKFQAIEGCV